MKYLLAALVIVGMGCSQKPQGFNPYWPDAIRCTWVEPPYKEPSSLVFQYKMKAPRSNMGTVLIYSFTGSRWDENLKYAPHELWFHLDGELWVPAMDPHVYDEVFDGGRLKKYAEFFLRDTLTCGGKNVENERITLGEISAYGDAFSFARPL